MASRVNKCEAHGPRVAMPFTINMLPARCHKRDAALQLSRPNCYAILSDINRLAFMGQIGEYERLISTLPFEWIQPSKGI